MANNVKFTNGHNASTLIQIGKSICSKTLKN